MLANTKEWMLRIVDNFYQTSLFFPMPTVIINDKRAKEKGKK